MNAIRFTVLALFLAIVNNGTSLASAGPTDWPEYQYAPSHNAVFRNGATFPKWSITLGGKIVGGLALVRDNLYAVSFDHRLYDIVPSTGQIKWSVIKDNVLMSTPVVFDNTVVIGSGTNVTLQASGPIWGRPQGDHEYGISAHSGRQLWSFKTVGEDMPSPTIVDGHAIFSNGDWHAYSLSLATGIPAWVTPLFGQTTMASANSDGLGHVFVSTCRANPYQCDTTALNARNGKLLWNVPYGGSDCSPTISGSHVFVTFNFDRSSIFQFGGTDGVLSINSKTGAIDWVWNGPSGPYDGVGTQERQISGVAADGVLYQPVPTLPGIVAFNERSGSVLWKLRTWSPVKMSPVVTHDHLFFGDSGGIFYSVNVNGELAYTTTFPRSFTASPPIISGQSILIANGRTIYSLPLMPFLR